MSIGSRTLIAYHPLGTRSKPHTLLFPINPNHAVAAVPGISWLSTSKMLMITHWINLN